MIGDLGSIYSKLACTVLSLKWQFKYLNIHSINKNFFSVIVLDKKDNTIEGHIQKTHEYNYNLSIQQTFKKFKDKFNAWHRGRSSDNWQAWDLFYMAINSSSVHDIASFFIYTRRWKVFCIVYLFIINVFRKVLLWNLCFYGNPCNF